nr:collagen alpha-1(I) chain-like [Aegilops tauschii subsp. strangulata]
MGPKGPDLGQEGTAAKQPRRRRRATQGATPPPDPLSEQHRRHREAPAPPHARAGKECSAGACAARAWPGGSGERGPRRWGQRRGARGPPVARGGSGGEGGGRWSERLAAGGRRRGVGWGERGGTLGSGSLPRVNSVSCEFSDQGSRC